VHNCQVIETVAVDTASRRDRAARKLTAQLMGHKSSIYAICHCRLGSNT